MPQAKTAAKEAASKPEAEEKPAEVKAEAPKEEAATTPEPPASEPEEVAVEEMSCAFIYVGPERDAHQYGGIQAYGYSFDREGPTPVEDDNRVLAKLRANPEFEEV